MAVEVDYYAVINADRKAEKEAIEAAIKRSMREWRKRTEAADLSVRQEAELRVKWIEEARTVLLNPNRRSQYDRELVTGGVRERQNNAATNGADGSWLDRALGYLALGDYHSAAYAAREATHVEGNNARTWWVRSRANAGLGRLEDALYEATQAVQIDDANADYHFNLGTVNEALRRWDEAMREYRRAATIDPGNPIYELSVAGVYLQNDRPDQALPIVEAVYKRHPQDEAANYYLGTTLIETAERVPKKRQGDMYWVSSADEITRMRALVQRATSLNIVDDEVRQGANSILQYLAKMEQKAWRPPRQLIAGALGAVGEAGCLGAAVMLGLVGALILLPVILVLTGFAQIASGNGGGGFLMLLIGGLLGFIWVKVSYIPRWKHNLKDLK